MKFLFFIAIQLYGLFFFGCNSCRQSSVFDKWQAGKTVTESELEAYGVDNCFVAESIGDEVFARMYGKSYKYDCSVPREQLRYLKVLHRDFNNRICMGEITCNVIVADKLLEIFRLLFDNNYPIERIKLIDDYDALDDPSMDDNNSSGFNFRFISGTDKLSNHSYGLAVDINPLYNPYVKERQDGTLYVSPLLGADYVDRNGDCPYMIAKGDLCYEAFVSRGFEWGGNWTSLKDYQHFEYVPKE